MKKKLVIFLIVLLAIASMLFIIDLKKNHKLNSIKLNQEDVELLLNKYRGSQIFMPCDNCNEPSYEEPVSIPHIMELRVILNKLIGASKKDVGEMGLGDPLTINIEYDGEYDIQVLILNENTVAINHDREVFTVYELVKNANIKTALTNLYISYKKD